MGMSDFKIIRATFLSIKSTALSHIMQLRLIPREINNYCQTDLDTMWYS